jgi:hypothetical protein
MFSEIRIATLDDLLEKINTLPNNYIYRGQADARWALQSSLERMLDRAADRDRLVRLEEYSLDCFRSKFHLYDKESNNAPNSTLAWLAAMQHYGVPTRLLDFSSSPYIALYFALASHDPSLHDDLALYVMDYSAIMQASIDSVAGQIRSFSETRSSVHAKRDEIFDDVIDRGAHDVLWVTEPKVVNTRVDKQSGTFLISGNRRKTIEELLAQSIYSNCDVQKLIIPKKYYDGLFVILRKVNISAKTLYGDLYGLAGSIRMELRVYV